MSNPMEEWERENAAYAVGQTADLHTKKKGSSAQPATIRGETHALQEQLSAALIRETEHLKLIRLCQRALLEPASPQLVQSALTALKAVV